MTAPVFLEYDQVSYSSTAIRVAAHVRTSFPVKRNVRCSGAAIFKKLSFKSS